MSTYVRFQVFRSFSVTTSTKKNAFQTEVGMSKKIYTIEVSKTHQKKLCLEENSTLCASTNQETG